MSDKKIVDYVTFQRMKAHLPKKAVLPSPKAQQAVADFCIDSGVAAGMTDEALLKIITQPAPSFYVTKDTVMVTVYNELRKKKKRIWQDC